MPQRLKFPILAFCLACATLFAAPSGEFSAQGDLDVFMAKVLATRDGNWKKLQQYILDERAQSEVRGPGKLPLWGFRMDFTWYMKDGFFVRSPVRVNGVAIGEAERRGSEERFLRREKEREKRRTAKPPASGTAAPAAPAPATDQAPSDAPDFLKQTREPQFISSAYFLKFKFEAGKYAFVGRETIDGREVLKVEYYPARLFSHEQDNQTRRQAEGKKDKDEDWEATMEQMLNKVSLVTLWVEPKAHQIVRYTFDDVNADFLPGAAIFRLTDLKATMNMGLPFPDVWLPRNVEMYFSGMLAIGEFDVRYKLDYTNYKLATTTARIK